MSSFLLDSESWSITTFPAIDDVHNNVLFGLRLIPYILLTRLRRNFPRERIDRLQQLLLILLSDVRFQIVVALFMIHFIIKVHIFVLILTIIRLAQEFKRLDLDLARYLQLLPPFRFHAIQD